MQNLLWTLNWWFIPACKCTDMRLDISADKYFAPIPVSFSRCYYVWLQALIRSRYVASLDLPKCLESLERVRWWTDDSLRSGNSTTTEIIGVTDPIKVSWKEEKDRRFAWIYWKGVKRWSGAHFLLCVLRKQWRVDDSSTACGVSAGPGLHQIVESRQSTLTGWNLFVVPFGHGSWSSPLPLDQAGQEDIYIVNSSWLSECLSQTQWLWDLGYCSILQVHSL